MQLLFDHSKFSQDGRRDGSTLLGEHELNRSLAACLSGNLLQHYNRLMHETTNAPDDCTADIALENALGQRVTVIQGTQTGLRGANVLMLLN